VTALADLRVNAAHDEVADGGPCQRKISRWRFSGHCVGSLLSLNVLGIPWVYQVVKDGTRDVADRGVRCVPATTFFAALA
jgi:hypothetical protein